MPHTSPDTWLDEHGNALYRYALLRLRDPHKAEELVQDTFVSALQGLRNFNGEAPVRTWLIGILKHKITDQFRREAREISLDNFDHQEEELSQTEDSFAPDGHWANKISDWGNPEKALENQQFWELLQFCMDHLPKRLARLFLLREILEEESENICQDFAITPTNLWTMLYRARMGLRQCLDRHWVGSTREIK